MQKILLFGVLVFFGACSQEPPMKDKGELLSYVDPYIGSGFHGHVFVGTNMPFGNVQLGPNNYDKGWDWCSGYHYSDSLVVGFSHTHLSGTGCMDLGDIQIMPYMGDINIKRGNWDDFEGSFASKYYHEKEYVDPSLYKVELENGVKVSLTTTPHVGIHKYEFPNNNQTPRILVNVTDGMGDRATNTFIEKVDEFTLKGFRESRGWSPRHKTFFVLKSDAPIKELNLFDKDKPVDKDSISGLIKGVMTFKDNIKEVQLHVAISSVSCENAMLNLEAETKGWDFNNYVSLNRDAWESELSRIKVESNDENFKKVFYTAMYHTAIAPTLYCDVNGEYRGHDDKVYKTQGKNYSTLSLWDTYRALNPLFTITQTDKVDDIVNSMLSMYDQQGYLPIWPLTGGETHCMPGYSSIEVISDAYLKGFRGFDAKKALDYMVSSANNDRYPGIKYLKEKGYIPADKEAEATSKAMEYAVADWGIAHVAKAMGNDSIAQAFDKRSDLFDNYFDKSMNVVRPKLEDGTWRTPYDPIKARHGVGDFCEGNGYHYSFFAPQHPEKLISLYGGDDKFIEKLDSLFLIEGNLGEEASPDISGLIGQYVHGNEPSHHVLYLYPFAGEQWKTAEKVSQVMSEFYTSNPDGIIGNEDCGQMSAWYILSALGIYQVNPMSGIFVFGTPKVDKASIPVKEGKTFVITANNNGGDNIYIQSVVLNGKEYPYTYIKYDDIMNGGELIFNMGNTPNNEFGKEPADRPYTPSI
ncbi:MAG: GH92 family glycosyl hydrolase [Bacteroidales bacterium]|nr:GH92 family glycosyl hydrolase [Bacteroidales bacterium]